MQLFSVLAAHCHKLEVLKIWIINGSFNLESCTSIPTTLKKLILTFEGTTVAGIIVADATTAKRALDLLQVYMPATCELELVDNPLDIDLETMMPYSQSFQ